MRPKPAGDTKATPASPLLSSAGPTAAPPVPPLAWPLLDTLPCFFEGASRKVGEPDKRGSRLKGNLMHRGDGRCALPPPRGTPRDA